MHAQNALLDSGTEGHTVEGVLEALVELHRVSACPFPPSLFHQSTPLLDLEEEAVLHVDGTRLVIASQENHVRGMEYLFFSLF